MAGRTLAAVAAASLAVVVSACGESTPNPGTAGNTVAPTHAVPSTDVNANGDIPDTGLAYISFAHSGGFTVDKVPAWSRADSGGVVTFSSHFDSVRAEAVALATAPTMASVASTEIPIIKQQAANVVITSVTTDSRIAGPVIVVKYHADSAADPVTGRSARLDVERYDFWHAGTEAVLTLSAPTGSDNVDPWLLITNSLHWR